MEHKPNKRPEAVGERERKFSKTLGPNALKPMMMNMLAAL